MQHSTTHNPNDHWGTTEEPLRNPWGAAPEIYRITQREWAKHLASTLNHVCFALGSQLDLIFFAANAFFSSLSPPCLLYSVSFLDYWSKTSLLDARSHPWPIKTEFMSLQWTINKISNIYDNLCVREKLKVFDECLPRQGADWDCDSIKRGTMNKITNTLILNPSCSWDSLFLF